jgi:hypothetical protein
MLGPVWLAMSLAPACCLQGAVCGGTGGIAVASELPDAASEEGGFVSLVPACGAPDAGGCGGGYSGGCCCTAHYCCGCGGG